MPTKTTLSIKSTNYMDNSKTTTDTINYVNPNIDNNTALELAQRIQALSKNSYKSTDRIDTINIDTPKPAYPVDAIAWSVKTGEIAAPSTSEPINLTATVSQINTTGGRPIINFRLRTPWDGHAPLINNSTATGTTATLNIRTQFFTSRRWDISFFLPEGETPVCSISFTVHFDETEQYAAYDRDVTLNIVADE